MKLQLRYKGGPGSGHFQHAGRIGERGGSLPSGYFGQPEGIHTSEGQKKVIAYLEHETGIKFKPFGSLKDGGKTSKNDIDIVVVEPSVEEQERLYYEQLNREAELYQQVKDGKITLNEFYQQTIGDPNADDEITAALKKIGYEYHSTAAWQGITVNRYENSKTKHNIELWMSGDAGYEGYYTQKGGPGSGFHDHAGRPGEVGGSAPAVTHTENFKKWFGDSKVVDENGNPLRVYHGTSSEFSVFDIEKYGRTDSGLFGAGFYFSSDPEYAGQYAEVGGEGAQIYPVYLSIQNPFIVDWRYGDENRKKVTIPDAMKQEFEIENPEQLVNLFGYRADFVDVLKRYGYDGVMSYTYHGELGYSLEAVAFSPTQIKSAIGNTGAFDPNSPDITKEIAEKGGQGSGHFHHQGRPGKVGGSTASDLIYYSGKIRGYLPIARYAYTPEDMKILTDTFNEIKKIVPSMPTVNYSFGRIPGAETTLGLSTKTTNEEPLIVLNFERIDALASVMQYERENKIYKNWFQMKEINKDTIREHVIAHELGHVWWHSKSEKSTSLVDLEHGGRGIVETNAVLNDWRDTIWKSEYDNMSGYAKDSDSHQEGFADSFAAFVTGENMDPDVEKWFLENVK